MEIQSSKKKIGLETSLSDLSRMISYDQKFGRIKKGMASSRLIGMLSHLNSDEPFQHVPRKIKTVGGLYTVTEDEMLHKFRHYKKRTWLRLNEVLDLYGLPGIKLPQEYTADQ
jgi:hypothetical protein